jgi:CBS domain-containing protein
MRCPACEIDNVAGAELCENCGQDLLDTGVPRARGGMQTRIFKDRVSDLDPEPAPQIPPSASVGEAVRLMKEKRHGSVLVVEKQRLVGLFTERDVLLKLAGRRVDLETTPVGLLMSAEPATLHEDDPVSFAVHLMAVRGLRHIPILKTGSEAEPAGVVSIRGVLRYLTLL